MKFENIQIYNFSGALRGMRNPKESWELSDSEFGIKKLTEDCALEVAKKWASKTDRTQTADFITEKDILQDYSYWLLGNGLLQTSKDGKYGEIAFIGPNDMKLAQTLIKAGSEHRKFMRQIFVSVDITAPLYWFKEFDTYKIGTVENSTSTMHKLAQTPITIECFELENLDMVTEKTDNEIYYTDKDNNEILIKSLEMEYTYQEDIECIIEICEKLRQNYLNTKDLRHWKMLIQALPDSWLQTRTVTMDYENLLAMCSPGQRRFHKLTEWSEDFIKFARQLPYAQQLLFLDEIDNKDS